MTGVAIGIDLGTSGIRAALVDARRNVVTMTSAPIAAAERSNPDVWWRALREAIGALAREASLVDVESIAVDGISGTILPVDTAGRPLAPARLYNARADPAGVARVARVAPPGSAARGASSPLARALAWRNLKGWAHLQHEADWLAGRLCGRFGLSDWNNALKTGYDPAIPGWPEWLRALDLDPALLPEVVPPGQTIGQIAPSIAQMLDLPTAVRIVAGTTDGCAAFLATGAVQEGDGVTSLGTTLTLKILSPRPVLAPDYGIYSHRIGSLWVPGGASNTGGGALAKYFSTTKLAALSARIDPSIVSELDFYPLPSAGERFPIADPALPPRETPRPADDVVFLRFCTGCWRASRGSRRRGFGALPISGHHLSEGCSRLGVGRVTRCGRPFALGCLAKRCRAWNCGHPGRLKLPSGQRDWPSDDRPLRLRKRHKANQKSHAEVGRQARHTRVLLKGGSPALAGAFKIWTEISTTAATV
jgi:sugar (pentulose or hexulose) kinase